MKRLLSVILAAALSISLLPLSAFAAVNPKDPEFQSYLKEIGMTEKEFIKYLQEYHDDSLKGFEDLTELRDYLGDTINEQNLKELLSDYDLTQSELERLLQENGMSLDEFVFIGDLEFELHGLLDEGDLSEEDLAAMEKEIMGALAKFGITQEEFKRLVAHFEKGLENTDKETFLSKLESLGERMGAFPEFESASELTPSQIAEFLSIWDELLNLSQVKVEYFLVKDGVETPVSLSALIQMDDIKGADLLIKIYSADDGSFLADVLITKEMFGSAIIQEAGEKTKSVTQTVAKSAPVKKAPAVRTVNGGKLPNTASDYIPNVLAGLAFTIFGALLFRRLKAKGV